MRKIRARSYRRNNSLLIALVTIGAVLEEGIITIEVEVDIEEEGAQVEVEAEVEVASYVIVRTI